jgi:hypothetical protein
MKVFVQDDGDMSVGIPPSEMTIEVNFDYPDTKEEREELREACRKFALEHFEFCPDWPHRKYTEAWFGDECPDCKSQLDKNGKCTFKGCITYGYEHDELQKTNM